MFQCVRNLSPSSTIRAKSVSERCHPAPLAQPQADSEGPAKFKFVPGQSLGAAGGPGLAARDDPGVNLNFTGPSGAGPAGSHGHWQPESWCQSRVPGQSRS
eukprot:2455184-Rhodomonas_salina.6